jgi:hypothetical protein
MLMGVTSWELGVLRVPLIMVPDRLDWEEAEVDMVPEGLNEVFLAF